MNNCTNYYHFEYDVSDTNKKVYVARSIFSTINILNQKDIPYNLVFFEDNAFIFPRYHQKKVNANVVGWVEFCGLFIFYEREEYNLFDEKQYIKEFERIKLSDIEIEEISREIVNQLEKIKTTKREIK